MNLGNELKKIRIDKGITQTEMSRLANVAQGRVSMVENDKYHDMSQESLQPMLDVLGISYAELAALAQTTEDRNTISYTILEKINNLTEALFPGNGLVVESKPRIINKMGDTLLLPVELDPISTIKLDEPVGDFQPGDILFFIKIQNKTEIKQSDVLIAITAADKPLVFSAVDMEGKPEPIGKAIRVLKQL